MAGIRERSRMPYETSKTEKFAYGLSPRKFRGEGGKSRAISDEEWARYPALEDYRDRRFASDPEHGAMIRDPATKEYQPFRDVATDVEMTEEDWEGFFKVVAMASAGEEPEGVAAEDPGFFRRIIDLYHRMKSVYDE